MRVYKNNYKFMHCTALELKNCVLSWNIMCLTIDQAGKV